AKRGIVVGPWPIRRLGGRGGRRVFVGVRPEAARPGRRGRGRAGQVYRQVGRAGASELAGRPRVLREAVGVIPSRQTEGTRANEKPVARGARRAGYVVTAAK